MLYIESVLKALVVLSLVLLGVSFAFSGNDRALMALVQFYHLDGVVQQHLVRYAVAVYAIFCAALIGWPDSTQKRLPFLGFVLFFAFVPLLTLFSPTRWIADLGGFPVIGSGQGIIKYYALIPLAVYLFYHDALSSRGHALFNASSIVMVLVWIGGMKFTTIEAKGIEDLLVSSPFLSWLYTFFSVQEASNLIGVYDLLFALLLAIGLLLKKPMWAFFGLLGASAVFFVTQSFLFSVSGALSSSTLLSGTGQFLIKDLWFIANGCVVLLYLHRQLPFFHQASHAAEHTV